MHVKAECALRDHPTLGRWLRQQASGRLVLDRKKIPAQERLDGKYLRKPGRTSRLFLRQRIRL